MKTTPIQITDSRSVLHRAYWERVNMYASVILEKFPKANPQWTPEDFYAEIHEAGEVGLLIHEHLIDCIAHTKNLDAYQSISTTIEGVTGMGFIDTLAFHAFRADIFDALKTLSKTDAS